jgi:transcriptional regulator with XRE-family HTH domain
MSDVHKHLAAKIKQLRMTRRMTQGSLAKKAGLSLGYVARLEISRHDPSLSTLIKLARALKVKVGALLN